MAALKESNRYRSAAFLSIGPNSTNEGRFFFLGFGRAALVMFGWAAHMEVVTKTL
ncbi:hypothetical protein [Nitrobacter hamburgensis]|uniref:hypothetical protein n=1 Tax=Nitrobacter hamburgensis TaxID=912 RepID=UPI00030D676F|nr:hypothetical protein [Nitrobacter hamburgensis]